MTTITSVENMNKDIRAAEMLHMNRTDDRDHDPYGDKRVEKIFDGVLRAGTGGLCWLDCNGEVALKVDPAKYAGVDQ